MRKFATTAPVTAVLHIPAGRIQLIAADRSDATVEVRPSDASRSRDVKAAEEVVVAFGEGVLRVTAKKSGKRLLGHSGSVEVTVQLPAGSHVEAHTTAAELRGVGRLGSVAFDGAYRRIKIDEAAGVRLAAVEGDVEIGRLNGPAEISTTRGDIRISEAVRGTVALRTRSGDISVTAAPGVSAVLDARTGLGRVDNSLRNDGAAELGIHAATSHGDIAARSL